ncbi:hypothetical protein AB0K21_22495 [Streptosporangium sp. NPDC049248]|uniref:hypothetical protein n=1 Tax=Streptosporangium sp. NPDC049248 TaxID=3155651 RepID=UPI003424702D
MTQRIRRAQELLESTDDSVDAIASAAGMGTAMTGHGDDTAPPLPPHDRRTTGHLPSHVPGMRPRSFLGRPVGASGPVATEGGLIATSVIAHMRT